MAEEKKKYNELKLHERVWCTEAQKDILRVPGGLIYSDWDEEKGATRNGVFVPFNQFKYD